MGFDRDGFFIVERPPKQAGDVETTSNPRRRILFRARRFEQRWLEPASTQNHNDRKVEYYNADTEERFICAVAVSGKTIPWPDGRMKNDAGQVRLEYPRLLHVEKRKIGADAFRYITDSLIIVCKASVETGNPVIWC